jgi:hypothetical protein
MEIKRAMRRNGHGWKIGRGCDHESLNLAEVITLIARSPVAWPSTGEILAVKSHEVIGGLTDENGLAVQGEKVAEFHFQNGESIRTGDQFGLGRKS